MMITIPVLDYIFLQLMWICHVVYEAIISIGKKREDRNEETTTISSSVENIKRHFIHLYTTTSLETGRPLCYMDVYEIMSPSDEQRLREASSKGIPNKTYLKYNQKKSTKGKNPSQKWLGYSTMAL